MQDQDKPYLPIPIQLLPNQQTFQQGQTKPLRFLSIFTLLPHELRLHWLPRLQHLSKPTKLLKTTDDFNDDHHRLCLSGLHCDTHPLLLHQ